MEYTWSRAFADGREAALLGGSAERLLDACERLSLERARFVSGFVEAPLLGAPEYDALVIHNPGFLVPGCRIADTAQQKAQEVLDWAAAMGEIRPYIHFELDVAGSGTLSGISAGSRADWIGRRASSGSSESPTARKRSSETSGGCRRAGSAGIPGYFPGGNPTTPAWK